MRMIPYGRQDVTEADVAAVTEVLGSDWLTQGPAVGRFEAALAAYCGTAHAVAVNSGTSALHVACLALGLGPGDTLWTSPNTFVASANCARYCGAGVDFVDIDPRTYNMSVAALEAKLARAAKQGALPKVVVPVHFGGQAAPMREIHALASRYGFRTIEDASHALGGKYLGAPVGNGMYSDITILSFHPVKIVTCGEGGAALTRDPALAASMALLRTHGVTRNPAMMEGVPHGEWYYEQVGLGYNYRMTDIQASLGASQVARIDQYVERRQALAARYDQQLAPLPVTRPWRDPAARSAFHLYVIRVDESLRRHVYDRLRAGGIGVNVHYFPVHLQPYYRRLGFKPGDFPCAEAYYAEALTLPLFPRLTEDEQDQVVRVLRDILH